MTFDAGSHWNKSHENHPMVRLPSNYGVEKEKLFPKNSVVCDLGGGDGTDSLYFLKNGHSVFLYDISSSALTRAHLKVEGESFESRLKTSQVDLAVDRIPSPDNFFDILYSRLSIHYFIQERTLEILKEIHRVLKNNGTAYIVVKSPEDLEEMNFLRDGSREIDKGVFVDGEGMIKTRFSRDQYEEMFDKAGITNFEINNYTERFGKQKIYVKSKANNLLCLELVVRKS
ncbi:MAG TPA: class I SAM-dependent methyltransferase [Patescibacteria group bacterium]|nr:class I SAM-dependent methyltransferase [Patescibacteria group bacterium]